MLKRLSTFFSRLSKRERFILYCVFCFISLALLDRLILRPILSKVKSLNREIQSQEATIKKNLYILAKKDSILKEADEYVLYVTHEQSQEEEVLFLLKEIEKLANKASVYVIDIKSAGLEEDGMFRKYLVKLNCEAQMEQITRFFYDVESSNKLLKIEKYDIKPKTEGSSVLRCTTSISKAVLHGDTQGQSVQITGS